MLLGFAAGVHLILQTQEAEMPRLMRAKARHLDVISQQVRVGGNGVVFARKELFLVIETRPPRKVAANLEVLAQYLPQHVGGMNAFGWIRVVSASCRMYMVIPRPPRELSRINPPRKVDWNRTRALLDPKSRRADQILRPA